MATDEEKLVISLEARLSKYERDMRKATEISSRTAKKIESDFSKLDRSMARMGGFARSFGIGGGVLGAATGPAALAAVIALVGREVVKTAQKMDDLADTAANIGIDVQDLQGLTIAFRQLGGEVGDVVPGLQKFSEELGEAQRGTGELKKLFDANGISLKNAAGEWRSLNEMLAEFADLVRGAPTTAMQQDLVKMATGARSLAPAFAAGGEALQGLNKDAQEAGKTVDNELVGKAAEFAERWQSGAETAQAAWTQFFAFLASYIETTIQRLENLPGAISGAVTSTAADEILAKQMEIERIRATIARSVNATPEDLAQAQARLKFLEAQLRLLQSAVRAAQDAARASGGPMGPAAPPAPTVMPPTAAETAAAKAAAKPDKPDKGMVTITTTGGLKATVSAAYADQFEGFIRELEASGYLITSLGGYNYRNIAGTNKLSQHAFGKAIDINPATNPFTRGALVTDMPEDVEAMAKRWGLAWGGAWKSVKDAMHFEAAELLGEEELNTAIATANAIETQWAQTLESNQLLWEQYLDQRQAATEATVEQLDAIRSTADEAFSTIIAGLRAGASAGDIFRDVLANILDDLARMASRSLTSALFGGFGTAAPGLLGGLIPGRQHGGPVEAGNAYVVGERQPELFVPNVSGHIMPSVPRGISAGAMAMRQHVGVDNRVRIDPSPLFMTSVVSTTSQMIGENNRRLPSYLADRQRRGV